MAKFNPMLAAEGVLGQIPYPIIGMPKLNGVRGVNQDGILLPRSLKKIKNNHTRELFSLPSLANLEGELVVGAFDDEEVFVVSTSGVGTITGTPPVKWYAFDYFHPTATFQDRLEMRDKAVEDSGHPDIILVSWIMLYNDEELIAYADWALKQGYEGLVLRDPLAKYKQGRSTAAEAGFMRYCPWLKGEAEILSIQEGKINNNESKVDNLGFKKKSSHQENMVGSGQAGSWTVRDLVTGIEFNMPVPGDALQKAVMKNPENYIGKLSHYYYKPAVKIGGKPRFPQHKGFRDPDDMS